MEKRIRVGKLEKLRETLSNMNAVARLQWADYLFGRKAVATACLGADCAVLLHMLAEASPQSRVFVVAPGDSSQETQSAVAEMERRLGLSVTLLDPWAPTQNVSSSHVDSGDALVLALDDAFCWISDRRKDQAPERIGTTVLERLEDGLYQLNPLFDWSQAEVNTYREQHGLPKPAHNAWHAGTNPLKAYDALQPSGH